MKAGDIELDAVATNDTCRPISDYHHYQLPTDGNAGYDYADVETPAKHVVNDAPTGKTNSLL